MYGLLLDFDNERIIYAETIYIEVLEVFAMNSVRSKSYKNLTKEEMNNKLMDLMDSYEDFELICAGENSDNIIH